MARKVLRKTRVDGEQSRKKTIRELTQVNEELRREVEGCRRREKQFDEMIRFEKLLSEISSHLVNLPSEKVGHEIERGLGRLGELLGADRGSVYESSRDQSRFHLRYSWTADGVPKSPLTLESCEFPLLSEKLGTGEMILVPRVKDLPEEAERDKESLKKYGIQSIIVIPLAVGKHVLGAVTLGGAKAEWSWPEEISKRVRLIGEIFANALARKRADEALRQAELEYRTVADFTYDWEYWVNPDGTLRYVSPSCERIAGYPPREFMDHPPLLREIVLPEDREVWDLHFRESRQEFGLRVVQFRIQRRDGEIRWIEHGCQPVKGPRGEFLGFRVSNRDITERKKADEVLQKSRAGLRRLSSRLISIQEEERKRISRELHDGIGQSLSAIKFLIENTLLKFPPTSDPSPIKSLEAVLPSIQNAIEEVRRIQADLRPSTLDDLGILPTLSWFCREYQKIYSRIRLEKEIHIEENEVPDSLKTVIFRVLQEATNNIAKHSQADRVGLFLRKKDEEIELVIEDNGVGFDPQEILSGERERRGFGLTSMRERTELSGGYFSVESNKGSGTRVRAVWRLKGSSSRQGRV